MNWKAIALITCSLAPLSALSAVAQDAQSHARQANRAYAKQQYEECSRLHAAAATQASMSSLHVYNGACCHALAGHKDEASALIGQAIESGG
jgi:hypothetical protein